MSGAEILIVEDDLEMAETLRQGFEQDHYDVTVARDGREAIGRATSHEFHAMILDVMLPVMDGFEVAAELRGAGNTTPILMLTALDSVSDKVRGLDCGAEDFLTKPFSFLELLARIRALIRRSQSIPSAFQAGDLVMDMASHRVARGSRDLRLTRTEYRLLEMLLRNSGSVVTRAELRRAGWGSAAMGNDNNLDVTMSSLRHKVDKGHAEHLIRTIRGFGYRIDGNL